MEKPEIRFKGYTDEWEQRKVGEFLTESRESGHKGDVAHKMTVKLWGKGVYEKNDAGSVNTQYFTRHAGQFIYSKLDFLNCAFGVVPEELESLETTADVPAFDCDGVNPHFMFYTAIQPSFYEKNGMIADGSRKAKRIHVDTFLDMPFIVPSLEEQNKIVNLLSGLDDLLTLHQRKCDEVKSLKKYMLQKMFPQNEQKVPEIRFEGFTEAWEQRKLSELSEKTFGGGTPKTSNESFWKGNIPWIQSSDLIEGSLFDVKPRKHISQEAVDKSATKLVPENSVAIVTRVGVGKLVFMPFSYATSQDFLSLSNLKTESQFTVYALYKKLQSELNAVQGTSIKGVTKDELLAKKVTIPCYEEQEKIGSYLHSLDNLITLHQQKCEELKKIKKFMLQKMFV